MFKSSVKIATEDQVSNYVGTTGEIVFDTDNNQLRMMDGKTAGGTMTNGNMDYGLLEDVITEESSTSESGNDQ